MARCPKCGHRLRLTDISQFCPECGVNMRFVNFEENFIREAKIAELSQATVHVKIKRLKGALIGSRLTIARLVVALLPAVTLLIPAGAFGFSLPFVGSFDVSLGALGIYSMFTAGGFDYLMSMASSALFGEAFSALRAALFSYAAIALFAVAALLATILCFLSIRNMQKIIAGISFGGAAVCAVNLILTLTAVKKFSAAPLSASAGFGACAAALAFCAVAVVNIILDKKGIPVEYAEGMTERVEIWKKVKSKELKIDDLPQPVVETAETRKIDEEIAAEEENFRKRQLEAAQDADGPSDGADKEKGGDDE